MYQDCRGVTILTHRVRHSVPILPQGYWSLVVLIDAFGTTPRSTSS